MKHIEKQQLIKLTTKKKFVRYFEFAKKKYLTADQANCVNWYLYIFGFKLIINEQNAKNKINFLFFSFLFFFFLLTDYVKAKTYP